MKCMRQSVQLTYPSQEPAELCQEPFKQINALGEVASLHAFSSLLETGCNSQQSPCGHRCAMHPFD